MKRNAIVSLMILSLMGMIFLPILSSAEGGLLPSLTETVGIAMPSLGEALERYPDDETENADGSITELYTNVSESDFNVFSVYLQQQEAELADYKAEKGILTAEIRTKGASFNLLYDSKASEARVTYPSGTFDEWVKNAKTHFDAAQKLLAEGKNAEAVAEIYAIPQYEVYGPADNLMKENEKIASAAAAHEANYAPYKQIGNIVTFGTYPQTTEGTDETPIEWIVLDYDEANNKALLLSKHGLDDVPYHSDEYEYLNITWEQCTLRTWLNDEFLKKAFSTKEQSAILTTDVDNSSTQGFWKDTDGGNNTRDQIFLLSYAEVNRYFGVENNGEDNILSRATPTAYAIAKGAYTKDGYKSADGELATIWWLRSPGSYQYCAAFVAYDGSLGSSNTYHTTIVVRPAFWLDLSADIFWGEIR